MAYEDDVRVPWLKILSVFLAIVVIGLALDWVYAGQNFFLYQYWGPKRADLERKVYTNTQSYKQGNTQRLDSLCTQVDSADDDHKPMLREVIKHEFSEWNSDDVPQHLRRCLADARAKH